MTQLLIIKPSSLGDIVQGLRVAASLKAQVPGLRISWIVRDIFAPLVRSSEAVDHVYVFNRDGGIKGFWQLMSDVRQTRFDYVFDFQGLLRTGLMTWRSRSNHKMGRLDAREGATFFYPRKAPLPVTGLRSHSMDKMLQFAPFVGATAELHGKLAFREVRGLNLTHLEGPGKSAPVLIFPDSRRPEKRWLGFKELTELIIRGDRRRKVVWAGNRYVPDKCAFLPDQFVNLTGNTSLVSLPSLIKKAAWVISNENGPMHLAAALHVPLLAIFGSSDPAVGGPYPLRGACNHIIQAPLGDLRLLSAKDVYTRFRRVRDLQRFAEGASARTRSTAVQTSEARMSAIARAS